MKLYLVRICCPVDADLKAVKTEEYMIILASHPPMSVGVDLKD